MGIISHIKENWRDLRVFGPGFLLRHSSHFTGRLISKVDIPTIGPVYVRSSESDVAAFRQVFISRDYDLGSTSLARARVETRYEAILSSGKIPVIIDAGANVGSASLWFAHEYPRAQIVAIEPEAGNLKMLHQNAEGRRNISVIDAAVGSSSGFVAVQNEGMGWGARTVRAETGMRIVTIDEAVATIPESQLLIAKIDIEGFESDLFAANLGWIEGAQMVIIEPHDWMLPGQHSSGPFQRAMAQHSFEIFLSGENLIYVRI